LLAQAVLVHQKAQNLGGRGEGDLGLFVLAGRELAGKVVGTGSICRPG
jgi:hypothetical protein